jgi:V/A-type H+-transporting ATPase subunit E
MNEEKADFASSGVEQLIERLREQAINAGQTKAEDIVTDAQKRATWLIDEAEQEAKNIVKKARTEADAIKNAGIDALNLAARDALLRLRDTLLGSFSQEVLRVVGEQMTKQDFMEQLILALAGQVRDKTGLDEQTNITLLLPESIIGVEELRKNPEELKQGFLSQVSAAIAGDLLRKGVKFEASDDIKAGLMIRLEENAMLIEFTDKAVTALLLKHLQPRFRALLQGNVK